MISVGERPQTYTLDRAATGTGHHHHIHTQNIHWESELHTK